MGVTLFSAPGHGVKPDGTYDPGAVFGGLVENDLARRTVSAAATAFQRSANADPNDNFTQYIEGSGGNHDPNFVGSVKKANELPASRAMEVHYNAGGGTGCEVWVQALGGEAEKWARAVVNRLSMKLGIANRGVKVNPNFGFLKNTNMPAILVEVAFVDGDNAKIKANVTKFCQDAGEAIAQGTLAYLGNPQYVAPSPLPTPPPNPCATVEAERDALKLQLVSVKMASDAFRDRAVRAENKLREVKNIVG